MRMASPHREAEVAVSTLRRGRRPAGRRPARREAVPGQRLRGRAGDVGAVAAYFGAVARAEEAVREAQLGAVDVDGLRIGERLGADRAPEVRADRGDRVEGVASRKTRRARRAGT